MNFKDEGHQPYPFAPELKGYRSDLERPARDNASVRTGRIVDKALINTNRRRAPPAIVESR